MFVKKKNLFIHFFKSIKVRFFFKTISGRVFEEMWRHGRVRTDERLRATDELMDELMLMGWLPAQVRQEGEGKEKGAGPLHVGHGLLAAAAGGGARRHRDSIHGASQAGGRAADSWEGSESGRARENFLWRLIANHGGDAGGRQTGEDGWERRDTGEKNKKEKGDKNRREETERKRECGKFLS